MEVVKSKVLWQNIREIYVSRKIFNCFRMECGTLYFLFIVKIDPSPVRYHFAVVFLVFITAAYMLSVINTAKYD